MATLMTTNKDLVDRHGVRLNSDGYCRTSGEIKSIQVPVSQWHIDEPYNSEPSRLVPLDSAYLAMKHYYTRHDVTGGTFEGGFVFNTTLTSTQFNNLRSKKSQLGRYRPNLNTLITFGKIPYFTATQFSTVNTLVPRATNFGYARADSSLILYYYGYNADGYREYAELPVRSFASTDTSYDTINLGTAFFTGGTTL